MVTSCRPVSPMPSHKWCGKLTSHYPVGSWLRPACSYLKRLSSLQPGWDDPVSHEVVACCAEVILRLQTEDPAQGVCSVPEDAQWSLWCDASDIAHGAVIQADGMIVEDGCWLSGSSGSAVSRTRRIILTRVPSSWMRCGKTLLARTAPSVTAAVVTVGPFLLDRVSAVQNADPRIASTRQQVIDGDPVTDPAFFKVKSQLVVHDGMPCRSVKLPPNDAVVIPVIPSSLESDVICAAHVNCGHASWEGTWRFLRSKCYFPNMAAQCQQFVRHCPPCAAAIPTKGVSAEASRPVAADGPWSVVVIDTLELGVDQSGEYHCVLVCMDTVTKWVEVVPLRQHDAASVAEAFVGLCTRLGRDVIAV